MQTVEYIAADSTTTPPIISRSVDIWSGKGDAEKSACVIALHAGGGNKSDMRGWAKDFTSRGYKVAAPDYGDTGSTDATGFTLDKQIAAIVNVACLVRFLHKNKSLYNILAGNIFIMGVSAGGLTAWQTNISIPLTDDMFKSPINNLYSKASMNFLGSASAPGDVNSVIYKLINSINKIHKDYHGLNDTILPIQDAINAANQMTLIGVPSTVASFNADHSLAGLHDIILADMLIKFCSLMGIPPLTPTS